MATFQKGVSKYFPLIAMVLFLPLLLIGVFTVKNILPRAYTPTATPPVYDCNDASFLVVITPETRSAKAGSMLTYSLTITNKAKEFCPQRSFYLSVSPDLIPQNWTAKFSTPVVKLNSEQKISIPVTFTSPRNTPVGKYKVGILVTVYKSDGLQTAIGPQATYQVITTLACKPRPACLDSNPPCQIPEPVEGWCK